MSIQQCKLTIVLLALVSVGVVVLTPRTAASTGDDALNEQLSAVLNQHGFTGRIGLSLEQRLGRKIDNQLADLGRLAFHDSLLGLNATLMLGLSAANWAAETRSQLPSESKLITS